MPSIKATYERLSTSQKFMRRFALVIKLIVAVIMVIFAIFPVLWIFSASLDPTSQLGSQSLIPRNAGLVNFQKLLNDPLMPFWRWIWNSVKISGITTILSVSITTMAAYAFSRLRFAGRINILKAIMLIQVFRNVLPYRYSRGRFL